MREDRPSSTARWIARAMVFLSREPHLAGLVPTPSAALWELVVRGIEPVPALSLSGLGHEAFRWGSWWLGRLGVPGMALHFALRKRLVEARVRRELEAGAEQLVVLGAGLDPLSLRLAAEHPEGRFFEVDHPATQEIKRRALGEPLAPLSHLVLLPLDLVQGSLEQALLEHPAYDPSRRTVFVAEGLFMYLEPADVEAVLAFARQRAGEASLLVFSFLERHREGRIGFDRPSRWLDAWLHRQGEPFRWGVAAGELEGYLGERGFALEELAGRRELSAWLPAAASHRLPEGEWVAVARRR